MKKIYTLLFTTMVICQGWSQFTPIPDSNFEQALINYGYDDVADGQVLNANVNGLTYLYVDSNTISSLEGIKAFTSLEVLDCHSNNLTILDLGGMTSLTEVNCSNNNQLSSLNLTGLIHLKDLDCQNGSLSSLDVSGCTALNKLAFSYNQISAADLSTITQLKILACSANQLASLNVSGLTALRYLSCEENQLLNLDLRGLNLTTLYCYSNPLTCITVDNVAIAEAKSDWIKDYSSDYSTLCALPGMILVPDTAFEQALIDLGYDTVIDGMVTIANINSVVSLDVSSEGISNLTGIEGFASLENLKCDSNQLTSLDLSLMSNLTEVDCTNNLLTSLDVTNLGNLLKLYCNNNQLKDLDLTGLNNLKELNCSDNHLTALNVSGLGTLTDLSFSNNAIYNIAISNLTGLETLACSNNGLESLSINSLTNITNLDCQNNALTELNLAGLHLNNFSAVGNTLLYCINVDDPTVAEANTNWTKDVASSYSTSCTAPSFFAVPDTNFEQALIDLGYDDVVDNKVLKTNVAAVTSLDVSFKNITNLTGIQFFTALTSLNCSNNALIGLDNNNLPSTLVTLNCSNNHIDTLTINYLFASLQNVDASNNELTHFTGKGTLIYLNLDSNQLTSMDMNQLYNIQELHFSNNNATSIEEPIYFPLPDLTKLYCSGNNFQELDLSNLPNLEYLDCSNSNMPSTSLFGPDMIHLKYLNCSNNNGFTINNFYINGLTSLEILDCSNDNMDMPNFNLGDYPALKNFYGSHNQLTSLGTIPASLLTLDCSFNKIEALDLTAAANLTTLNCASNKFVVLDLKGITNAIAVNCTSNATLSCILVDDTAIAVANTNWTKDTTADYALDCSYALYTAIPDPAFEQALIDAGYDNDNGNTLDGRILTTNAANATYLSIGSLGITDLTGIKAFININQLYCDHNNLSSLDVSGMSKLENITCQNNALTSVNLTGLTVLTDFICADNQMTSLDLTGTAIVTLDCSYNNLTTLNVSGMTSLESIETRGNQLTTLDVSGLTALKELFCGDNNLTSLNITGTTLDLLDCYSNEFVSLNLKSLPDSASMSCFNNSNLQCIEVNDVAVAENNTNWIKDSPPAYSLSCGGSTAIPDANFEQALIDQGYDDVIDGQVATVNIMNQGGLIVSNYGITDLTGIQDFKALVVLHCDNNQLTSLDLTGLTNLVQVICSKNLLTSLNVSGLADLDYLDCSSNQLTALNVSGLTQLDDLRCHKNKLTSLDITGLTGLASFQCSDNLLTSLNITGLSALEYVIAYGNKLTSLDVTGLSSLVYLDCGENLITSMDVTHLDALIEYYCYDNQMTSINVAGLSNLLAIDCSFNQITSLDESTLANMQYLDVNTNLLTELDLSGMADLEYMDCSSNSLTCIKVADVDDAEAQPAWYKDAGASYSIICVAPCSITTTWDGSSWSPFAPVADQKAIIAGNYTSTGDLAVCELEITGTSVVVISAGNNLTVSGALTVAPTAKLEFSNNANLLQDPLAVTSANSGNIIYNKNSSPLFNMDYTIWSSPTTGTQTLKDFSSATLDASFYVYNTALNAYSNYLSLSGIFGSNPNAVTFTPAKGYLIRMPAGLDADTPSIFEGQFRGTPNNGTISIPLAQSGNGFNAVGNPYPSPINIHEFIDANAANMDGTLYFWRKRNNSLASTYATITKLAYNANQAEGGDTGGTAFDGMPNTWVINPGQGFFLKTIPTASSLVFTNSMRRGVNNGQFFRAALGADGPMSRLWLNISNSNGGFAQTTVGYTGVTTLGIDNGWDGKLLSDGNISVYSMAADETKLSIQARLEFTADDIVPLGYKATTAGSFTIGLDHFDGVFTDGQDIFLKDRLQDVVHDLKAGNYSFASDAGTFDNRFELMYVNTTLGVDIPGVDANKVIVYKQGNSLNIDSGLLLMKEVQIFDIRGRLLYSKADISAFQTSITDLRVEQQVLIVQITTEDNARISKKIIY